MDTTETPTKPRVTIKATSRQQRNARNQKLPRFTATLDLPATVDRHTYLDRWDGEGATPDDAITALGTKLQRAAEYAYRRRYVFCADGTVFAFYWHAIEGHWSYDITDASRAYPCSASCSGDEEEAMAGMLRHAEAFGGPKTESATKGF